MINLNHCGMWSLAGVRSPLNRCAVIGLCLLSVGALSIGQLRADEWPQWRGAQRDGVWRETGIVDSLPKGTLPRRWSTPIGSGYSGPTVADGTVYVMDRLAEPKQVERIHALAWETGEIRWTFTYDCEYHDVGYVAGPRSSVTVDGKRLYALGTMGHLHCLDTAGQVIWKKDLLAEYKFEMPIWGIAASPLVYGDLVIVQIGAPDNACLVAFDKVSGKEVWRALPDRASYSSPIIVRQANQDVLVCWTGDSVAGLDPRTGKVHWQQEFKPTRMVIGIATPAWNENRIFVSSFYDGSLLLQLDPNSLTARPVWRRLGPDEKNTESLHSIISTPVLRGANVYGVDSHGELRCLDAATGDRIWEDTTAVPTARWATIHFVTQGDRDWLFNDRGDLIIAQLRPDGYHELSRAHLIDPTTDQLNRRDGVCWSHPAYAYRHIFARNDREIVCASLASE
ncbi:MAG: PQQ-binding-like beta-propeller repeat protein [Pirellulales bacterium]